MLEWASENAWMYEHVPQYGFVRWAVRRFVPGEDLKSGITTIRALKTRRIDGILTQLGESVTGPVAADAVTPEHLLVAKEQTLRDL